MIVWMHIKLRIFYRSEFAPCENAHGATAALHPPGPAAYFISVISMLQKKPMRSTMFCPGNSLGNSGSGSDDVMPLQAARSRGTSPELLRSTIPLTWPFFRIVKSINVFPCLKSGGYADSGRALIQFLLMVCRIRVI